jgi:glycosyltransferase involved in cell wall biosynthesis
MKIAIIQPYLKHSTGGERQVLELATELQKKGHYVKIFTSVLDKTQCFPDLVKKNNIKVVSNIKFSKFPQYNGIIAMLKIGGQISKDFDIINIHNFPAEWAGFLAKKRLKIPVVWMCNEPPFWFFYPKNRGGIKNRILNWPLYEIFDKFTVNSIDKIVVLSHLTSSLVKGIYHRPSVVIRSGVDVDYFQEKILNNNFRKKFGIKVDDFFILQVGSLVYYKHPEDSIKMLRLLNKKYPNIKLVFIGTGKQEPFKKLVKKLKLETKVLLLGPINDEEVKEAYQACDTFVFPAENQSWGLVVIEAMASGKPAIVSNKTGVSEVISDGENGFIFECRNIEQMAKKTELLINNENLREKIGENASNYIKENFSWEKYADKMEKIFKDSINQFYNR